MARKVKLEIEVDLDDLEMAEYGSLTDLQRVSEKLFDLICRTANEKGYR